MAEFSDYVEARTPVATPDGTEIIPVSKNGDSARMTSAQVAALAGAVTSVTGTSNRITSSGGATPVINIDSTYDAAITAEIAAAISAAIAIHILDYVNNVDTSGGTITLNLNSKVQRMFRSPDSFATPKTIALSNTTNGLVIDFKLIMSDVAAVLTFPTNFTMPTTDLRWNDSAHTFTPSATGEHEFSATFDGTDWDMKATNPFP